VDEEGSEVCAEEELFPLFLLLSVFSYVLYFLDDDFGTRSSGVIVWSKCDVIQLTGRHNSFSWQADAKLIITPHCTKYYYIASLEWYPCVTRLKNDSL
jgi:hypothetical protein